MIAIVLTVVITRIIISKTINNSGDINTDSETNRFCGP